jgi:hypothetical protein
MKFHGVEIVNRKVSSLLLTEWDEIWNLSQKYNEMDRVYFEKSIRCSQNIILIYEQKRRNLVGMAALEIYPYEHKNKKVLVIFTGGVILEPNYRGKSILQVCAVQHFLKARLFYPGLPCYWFFSSMSYKSYLLLSKNFVKYWPNPDCPTHSQIEDLMEGLAIRHYGALWNADKKVVHLGKFRRFRPWVAPIDSTHQEDRWVQFYLEKNPNYKEADALLCLAPLTFENWRKLFVKMIQRQFT